MKEELLYKNHRMFCLEFMGDWILYVEYAADRWIQDKGIFLNPDDAIAHGKAQIDILLSKSLNINKS